MCSGLHNLGDKITEWNKAATDAIAKITDCTEESGLKDICAGKGSGTRRILESTCCSSQYFELIEDS